MAAETRAGGRHGSTIKAVAGIADGYNSPSHLADQMRTAAYRRVLGTFLARYHKELPVVASGGPQWPATNHPPNYGTARSTSPYWENRVNRGSLHSPMTFDAFGAAPLLGATPLLIVHGKVEAYCASACRRTVRARYGEKEIHWLDAGQHIDLHGIEQHLAKATAATADFLRRHL